MTRPEKVSLAIVIALLAGLALVPGGVLHDWRDCKARGGKYVRGAIWFECVAPAPKKEG